MSTRFCASPDTPASCNPGPICIRRVCLVLLVWAACASPAAAQVTAAISGQVEDASVQRTALRDHCTATATGSLVCVPTWKTT